MVQHRFCADGRLQSPQMTSTDSGVTLFQCLSSLPLTPALSLFTPLCYSSDLCPLPRCLILIHIVQRGGVNTSSGGNKLK